VQTHFRPSLKILRSTTIGHDAPYRGIRKLLNPVAVNSLQDDHPRLRGCQADSASNAVTPNHRLQARNVPGRSATHLLITSPRKMLPTFRSYNSEEQKMNWRQMQARWDDVKGVLKTYWGDLSEEDLKVIDGNRGKLARVLHTHYALAADEIEREIIAFECEVRLPGQAK
jgi:uncharacterized protein YjbJ (UPF0337 family)